MKRSTRGRVDLLAQRFLERGAERLIDRHLPAARGVLDPILPEITRAAVRMLGLRRRPLSESTMQALEAALVRSQAKPVRVDDRVKLLQKGAA